MTEAQWLDCTDPQKMLAFLRENASDRKLRLFAVACCRRIWPLLADERSRRAVEVAEQYADDRNDSELRHSHSAADKAAHEAAYPDYAPYSQADPAAAYAASAAAGPWPLNVVPHASCAVSNVAFRHTRSEATVEAARVAEHREQCHLLCDIFGPLPLRPVVFDPSWPTSTVKQIAEAIYQERAFDRLPILADALEDAGCNDPNILDHCRQPGPHVRGCWVVDLVLGRG
jgi:hypothetical protein